MNNPHIEDLVLEIEELEERIAPILIWDEGGEG